MTHENTQRRTRTSTKAICILCVFVFLFVFFRVTSAEGISLNINPPIIEWDLARGEVKEDAIKVYNLSDVPLPVSVKVSDWTMTDEDAKMIFDDLGEDASFTAKKWINFAEPNFILQPNEMRRIEFYVRVPDDAEPGGHYSIAIFEPVLPSYYFEKDATRLIPQIGVIFSFAVQTLELEPRPLAEKMKVLGLAPPDDARLRLIENALAKLRGFFGSRAVASQSFVLEKSPDKFFLRIKNNDIVHHKTSGKILVYNTFGRLSETINVPALAVLPGKTRKITVEAKTEAPGFLQWLPSGVENFFADNSFLGAYSVVYENSEGERVFRARMWGIPWKMLIPVFALLGLVAIFRRRVVAATKALLQM